MQDASVTHTETCTNQDLAYTTDASLELTEFTKVYIVLPNLVSYPHFMFKSKKSDEKSLRFFQGVSNMPRIRETVLASIQQSVI